MKNTISILIALFVLSPFIGVKAQSKKMTTTLKGEIQNAQRSFFLLRHQGMIDTVKFSADGKFEIAIEQSTGNYFTLEHARQSVQIYLLPSDIVSVTLSAVSMLDAKNLTGASAPYCSYLIEKQKADKSDMMKFQSFRTATMSGDAFYALRDSIRTSRQNALAKSGTTNKFINAFTNYENKTFDYQMGFELVTYKSNASKNGTTTFPASINQFIKELNVNDEEVSFDNNFKSFALNAAANDAMASYYASPDKSVIRYFEFVLDEICKKITSDKNKSILISDLMPQVAKDAGTADLRPFVSKLEKCCSDQKLIASVKKLADQNASIYPGEPAPNAGFYDANGNISHISDYKGKVIYIDAWATWCGPCKREIPHLKTLEEEFHGKNVQFISVSTDKDVNAWKAFIAKEQMGGLQLHQSEKMEETISMMYMVNSIPRFIIIDEAGKIVTPDGPRPSSGDEIRNLLNGLLAD